VTAGAEGNPYRQARALAAFLRSDERFGYAKEAPVPSNDQDLVDFFLFESQTGYCEYYASAMVMMARSLGLPARVAVGYAPTASNGDETYTVREANAHAWAEVFFPGYGWQIFESTKTINPRFARATGDPSTVLPPVTLPGVDPLLEFERGQDGISTLPSFEPVEGGFDPALGGLPPDDGVRNRNALLIGILAVVAAVVVWFRIRQVQRRWRLLPAGDRAWRQLTAAADRAGVGPRPSETIYEYAGWLEDQLPNHVEPIRDVADGKVWQAYSGRRMTASASERLDAAIRKLRLPLLVLATRRGIRRLLRRDDPAA
jgi:Transglutaminase-like superfamily/Domain of unknown function (DUF4129)